jgi:hypothetical protein
MSYAKTAIYSNLTANSLILERDEGGRIYVFLRKKGRVKNLIIGVARLGHGGGCGGGDLIL